MLGAGLGEDTLWVQYSNPDLGGLFQRPVPPTSPALWVGGGPLQALQHCTHYSGTGSQFYLMQALAALA